MTSPTIDTQSKPRTRANFLPAPQIFNLHHSVALIREAFHGAGGGTYLVGSCLTRRDYRDVDVRCILPDDEFDALFHGTPNGPSHWQPRWSLLCISISQWLSQASGLPVDFQFQKRSVANAKFDGERQAIGYYIHHGDANAD